MSNIFSTQTLKYYFIYLIATVLLLPFLLHSFISIQTVALVSIIILISLTSTNPRTKEKIKISVNSKIIIPSFILFLMAFLELIHLNFSGAVYCLFSLLALISGFEIRVRPSNGNRLYTLILIIFLTGVSFNYKFTQVNYTLGATSNFLGGIVFIVFSLWYAVQNDRRIGAAWFWLLMVAILSISMTRSIMLGVIIGYFISYFSLKTFNRFIVSLFFAIIISMAISVNVEEIKNAYYAMDLLTATGKNLETGREDIWLSILQSMNFSDYLLGGFNIKSIQQLDAGGGIYLSAHNGYVSTLAQNGVIGLIALLTLPITIISQNYDRDEPWALFLVAFVLAFFTREFFEVTVHGNNFPIAGSFWFVCGLLISRIEKSSRVLRTASCVSR